MNHFPAANDAEASIEEVLVFVTGASRPPPLGFDEPANITFSDDEPFPMANTCANTIRLPVCYSEYEEFKRNMDFAIKNSPIMLWIRLNSTIWVYYLYLSVIDVRV